MFAANYHPFDEIYAAPVKKGTGRCAPFLISSGPLVSPGNAAACSGTGVYDENLVNLLPGYFQTLA